MLKGGRHKVDVDWERLLREYPDVMRDDLLLIPIELEDNSISADRPGA